MLTEEQAISIKEQLIAQIGSTFPEETKEDAISQIEEMDEEELEEFLIKNNLLKSGEGNSEENSQEGKTQKSIFRLIVEGKIPSFRIAENEEALAILEINPISKGHAIILMKKPIFSKEAVPQKANSLASLISERIKLTLSPKDVSISQSTLFNEIFLNILPVYENETLASEKKKASENELKELQKLIGIQDKEVKEEETEEKENSEEEEKLEKAKEEKTKQLAKELEENLILPIRIP